MRSQIVDGDKDFQVRPADIRTFLRAYRRATGDEVAEDRHTYEKLFAGLGNYTTTISQLERCVRYFFDESEWRRIGRRSEICLLFDRKTNDGVLEPTNAAHALFKQLEIVNDLYQRGRKVVRDALAESKKPHVVRLGSVQTLGTYVISSMFSNWTGIWQVWSDPVELQFDLHNSTDLIPRLHAALLDIIIAYGSSASDANAREQELDVRFHPLGYRTAMGLICHEDSRLIGKDGKLLKIKGRSNADAGPIRPGTTESEYDRLPEIDLDKISFDDLPLIVVPSWGQPEPIEKLVAELKPLGKVREVARHDEALALVRMQQGIALVTEVFLRRKRIKKFRLKRATDYEREIGVYYNPRFGLSGEACRLVEYVAQYLEKCEPFLRHGRTPAFNHGEDDCKIAFANFEREFREDEIGKKYDWLAEAKKRFPIER